MPNELKWRDDAAESFLAHPNWFMDGGFAGILFGAGNADCVNYLDDTDGGWFVNHMTAVSKTPIPLLTVGIRDRLAPYSRSVGPVLSFPGRGTPVINWPGNTQATLRNVQGRESAH
jgi:hypothetical protein